MYINPVLSASNDADDDLVRTIYSSLFKYDGQGHLENDLVDTYSISNDKTQYTIHLKKNVKWHDDQPLTAADVLFTINLISDPAYKSPLRSNWQGIQTSSSDDYTLTFTLQTPYVGFLNDLTFGILPKHIWGSIGPDKFTLTDLNLEPIGSGPYKYSSFQKDSNGNILSYKLMANPNYFDGKPYISKLTFDFYADDASVIDAYNKKEIMGISSISPSELPGIKLPQSTQAYKFEIPRYFAIFFNQTKSIPLATNEVRQALAYATNRQEIIDKVLDSNGSPVYAPILKGMVGYDDSLNKYDFNLDKANQILDNAGWARGTDGFRGKNNTALAINLVTTDWPELKQTAQIIRSQWEKIGVKVNITNLSISDIQQNYIRPREYEALLFGQVLGADPDPYSFWDSTQKHDPGLNLSLYGDSNSDQLITNGREEFDPAKRAAIYTNFQTQLDSEIPAIFLYSPDYVYPVNKSVHGINITDLISPAQRFSDITKWYIDTRRIWKK